MNKKIVCLVLALAMILTAGLALAHKEEHNFPLTEAFDYGNDIDGGKVLLNAGDCTHEGYITYLCLVALKEGGSDFKAVSENTSEIVSIHYRPAEHEYFLPNFPADKAKQLMDYRRLSFDEAVELLEMDSRLIRNMKVTKKPTCTEEGILEISCVHSKSVLNDSPTGFWYRPGENGYSMPQDNVPVEYLGKITSEDGVWCDYKYCTDTLKITIGKYDKKHVPSRNADYDGTVSGVQKYLGAGQHLKIPATGANVGALVDVTTPINYDGLGYPGGFHTSKAATCTTDGVMTTYCLVCDADLTVFPEDKQVEKALGHAYVLGSQKEDPDHPATCQQKQGWFFKCSRCDMTWEERGELGEHKWGNEVYEVKPTCTTHGTLVKTCQTCGASSGKELVEPIDHKNLPVPQNLCTYDASDWSDGGKASEYHQCPDCKQWFGYWYTGDDVTCHAGILNNHLGWAIRQVAGNGAGWNSYTAGKPRTITSSTERNTLSHKAAKKLTPAEIRENDLRPANTLYKPATCVTAGTDIWWCDECSKWWDVEAPALGHSYTQQKTLVVLPATCTTDGIGFIVCDRCDQILLKDYTAKDLEAAEKWLKDKASDIANGVIRVHTDKADDKGQTLTQIVLPATGHNWSDWKYYSNDNGEIGYAERVCSNCGERTEKYPTDRSQICDSKDSPDGDHNPVLVAAVKATCDTDGNEAYFQCSYCDMLFAVADKTAEKPTVGDVITEKPVVKKLGHKLTDVAGKDATCTEAGVKAHKYCETCEKNFIDDKEVAEADLVIAALGHKLTDVAAKAATCTEAGVKAHKYCETCKKNFIDEKEVAEADLVITALGHKLTDVAEKAANCPTDGVKAHKVCSVCGKKFVDDKEVTDADLVIKAAAEHEYEVTGDKAATCTEKGYTGAKKCKVCGNVVASEEIAALGHDFSVEVAEKKASYTEKGNTAGKKCSRCDVTEGVEVIDYLKGMTKAEDGKFYYYANGAVDKTFTGVADFEGGKFYIKDGELNSSFNGVSDIAYKTEGVFYYFADGQVQLQHTGLAMYDGEWFKLKDGKVDLDFEGTYAYDGSTFWVSVGRIVKELNGVHPEADGVYYYANGERNACNGIVSYMGSYFYFEGGKMVTMTGEYKDFNGNAWNVVNGQAYPLF